MSLELDPVQRAMIDQAARLSRQSTPDFCVSVLSRAAAEIVREAELRKAFNDALDRPARTLVGLSDLLRRPSVFES